MHDDQTLCNLGARGISYVVFDQGQISICVRWNKIFLCLYLQYMVMNVTFTSSKANLGYFTSLLQSWNKFLKFQILGSVVFEVNTLIARPHLSSFMHNEWCPKFWRKENVQQTWDHCITFYDSSQSKSTKKKKCEILKEKLSRAGMLVMLWQHFRGK